MQGRKNKKLGTERVEELKESADYILKDISEYNKSDIQSIQAAFHRAANRRNFSIGHVLIDNEKVLMIIRK